MSTTRPRGASPTDHGYLSGNILVIASTTAVVIGVTWGGVQYPWSSARVLVPLILGLVGLAGFFVYEATLAHNPIVSKFGLFPFKD